MIEEMDTSVKENVKSKNIQEIWNTMKRPNLRMMGIEEGQGTRVTGTENTFNKITEENSPNLKKEMPIKVQEACRTPQRLDQKNKGPSAHNNQNTKHSESK